MSWREFIERFASRPMMVCPRRLAMIGALMQRFEAGQKPEAEAIAAAVGRPLAVGGGLVYDRDPKSRPTYQRYGSVGVVDVWGLLDKSAADVTWFAYRWGTGYDEIRRGAADAKRDPDVRTIALRIDSPGGDALTVETAALDLFAMASEAEGPDGGMVLGGKPVVAIADGYTASAALYLAAQANRLFTTPGSWIGSIGTIMHAMDYTVALEKYGVKVNTIKSHALKDVGSPYRPMSEKDREVLQREVDRYDSQFIGALARGRRVNEATARQWQDGHGWIGKEAADAGLADSVATSVEAVIAQLNASPALAGRSRVSMAAVKVKAAEASASIDGSAGQAPAAGVEAAPPAEDTTMRVRDLLLNAGAASGVTAPPPAEGSATATKDTGTSGTAGGASGSGGSGALSVANAAADAIKAERTRVSGIMARAVPFASNPAIMKLRDEAIDQGLSPQDFADKCMSALGAAAKPTGHVPGGGAANAGGSGVSITDDARDKGRRAMGTALLMRISGDHVGVIRSGGTRSNEIALAMGYESAGAAIRDFDECSRSGVRGRSLLRMAAASIVAAGFAPTESHALDMSGDAVRFMASAGHSTSDFPLILSNVANKRMLAMFAEQAAIWQRICRRGTASDYKESQMLSLSEAPNIEELEEGQVPKEASFNERKEGITVKAQGKRFGMTYQMMRNDDLNAFANVLQLIIASFLRNPDIALVRLLELNSGRGPTMGDGVTMFHANHSNIVGSSGTALSYENLRVAWTAFREKKGFGPDTEYIEIAPKVLVTKTTLELTARDLVTQAYAPSVASGAASTSASVQTNIFKSMLEPVASPRFTSGTRWWLFAEPGPYAAIEARFLDGNETPQIDRIVDSDPLSLRWQATQLGFGMAAANWEGAIVNDGA